MAKDTVSQKERQSLEYWSGRAREYSQLHMSSYVSDKRMDFSAQVAQSIPPSDGVKALDLGCGSGFMSMILLDAGCQVTGVDFSEDMLARARENLKSKGYEADFLCMRAQQLDFPDESFDFVVSRNVTWTLEDVDVVYTEVMRVLKDDGVFLNLDANYGRVFNEADARGEAPTHPTQTAEQLRMRNDIAHDLAITMVDRPQWDIDFFWRLGASEVCCRRVGRNYTTAGTEMFALEVHKGKAASLKPAGFINSLNTRSQQFPGTIGMSDGFAFESRSAKVMLVDYVRIGEFEFDPQKFVVRKRGVPIKLTPKEFNLLLTLARNAGKTMPKERLMAAAWGSEFSDDADSLAVYIRRIRAKIEDDPANPHYVVTHWGKGYSFAFAADKL